MFDRLPVVTSNANFFPHLVATSRLTTRPTYLLFFLRNICPKRSPVCHCEEHFCDEAIAAVNRGLRAERQASAKLVLSWSMETPRNDKIGQKLCMIAL